MSMQSSAERERAFRDALKTLCEQHGAEIEITDSDWPYGMKGGLIVTMQSVYEGDECVKEFCEFRW
jgi:hypothetical protein